MDLRYFSKKIIPRFWFYFTESTKVHYDTNQLHPSLRDYRFVPKRTKTKSNENLQTNKAAFASNC